MKRSGIFLLLALTMATMLTNCRYRLVNPSEVEIGWELISNTRSEQARTLAEFTIRNNSGFRFDDKNWALFYSQAPRGNIVTSETSPAEVEWINGDWHRITPRAGFDLPRGREVRITYEADAWWIKESDAPMGLYFVFYDNQGNEIDIVPVDNFTIMPFVREEQISRHRNDMAPIPTPELRFGENRKMSLIPENELLRVIPTPVRITRTGDVVNFNEPVNITYQDGLRHEAEYLAGFLEKLTGQPIIMEEGTQTGPNNIMLGLSDLRVNGVNREAYRLAINRNKSISITGSDNAGVFYAIQTLIALLPVPAISGTAEFVPVEVLTIEDAPRFGYRGIHIDVARNFQEKETILKILDLLAFYKINTLHFHLTEDEGWRIEIKDLPELTEIGGQREHAAGKEEPVVHPAYGSGPFPNAEGTHGSGYYTHDDFVEILRYAKARHIRIIPEVNMPGHSRAAIKAMETRYNRFMAVGKEDAANEFRLIDPDETSEYLSAQSFTDNVVNVARESVYRFFETVVDGILDMYEEADAPIEIFHTGGDEVPEGSWTRSPMIDELMQQMPEVTDPKNLQAYFFDRAIEILRKRNLKIAGWEEVAMLKEEDGTYVPNKEFADGTVIPYMWNSLWGHQDLGYRLANLGYPVVLCHVSNFYFDLAYNNDPEEPGLYWAGFVDTKDAWYYAPFDMFKTTVKTAMGAPVDTEREYAGMERLRPGSRNRILGLQAQLWSETILGQEMLQYYMLPKMIGFAESAWTSERSFERIQNQEQREQEAQKHWNIFANTIAQREFPRLAALHGGYNYRIPLPGAVIENRMLFANIEYPGLIIRYTENGEEPGRYSTVYEKPVEVSGTVKLKAFDRAGGSSRTVIVD